ncbi:MAG: DUF4193 family protein [Acidimicrobiales bacterium]|nr:DUF4193 family protein [Acidimicrobiales bacterium]
MSEDDLEVSDLDELGEIDEDLLDEELLEEDVVVGLEEDDDVLDLEVEEEEDEILVASPAAIVGEEDDEDDEMMGSEDVEASLDVILKSRLVAQNEIDDMSDEDDEAVDLEDRTEPPIKVLPKQDDEFVCQSCFLVKNLNQLADKKNHICRDCV